MREKATKAKSSKKSGGRRKARPVKGRAKRAAAQGASTKRQRPKGKGKAKSKPAKPVAGKRKSGGTAGGVKASAPRGKTRNKTRKPPASRSRAKSGLTAGAAAAVSSATRAALRAINVTARRLVRAGGLTHAPRSNRSARRRMAGRSSASAAARRVRSSKRTRLRVPGVVINALAAPRQDEILTPQAVAFLAGLHRAFDGRRRALLQARSDGVAPQDAGGVEWTVASLPVDPVGRVIESADAADRQMILKALHSGATDCLADFAGADARGWPDVIAGQVNLRDLCNGKVDLAGAKPALLVVRPRPWHVPEAHVLVDASPISAGLFDFGLYVFHNARAQIAKAATPHFQLSHLASQAEARLWNDVFVFARDKLDIPPGAIKARVLIDGLTAFEATC
jgi:hypothetical protein